VSPERKRSSKARRFEAKAHSCQLRGKSGAGPETSAKFRPLNPTGQFETLRALHCVALMAHGHSSRYGIVEKLDRVCTTAAALVFVALTAIVSQRTGNKRHGCGRGLYREIRPDILCRAPLVMAACSRGHVRVANLPRAAFVERWGDQPVAAPFAFASHSNADRIACPRISFSPGCQMFPQCLEKTVGRPG
jgi:hypothetical protein